MSEDTKQLEDFTASELRDYAKTRDIDIPEEISQKAALVHIIRMAEAPPAGTFAEVDATDEKIKSLRNGEERVTRPVRVVEDNGDWRCPFTGLRIWHGQTSNPENGATVETATGRKQRKDALGHVYVPVENGDLAVIVRPELEDEAA